MKVATVVMTLLVGTCLAVLAAACEEGKEEATATPTATGTVTAIGSPTELTVASPSPPASTPTAAVETPTAAATPSESIVPTTEPADIPRQGSTLGYSDAPLTIVEYSDFLCSYCARAALNTVPQIEEEYIASGKVKLVFKHYIVHGQKAVLAAGAAECASEQNAFWGYHDLLFLKAGGVDFSIENLKQFAEDLELDKDSFNTCLDSERYVDKLAADVDEAGRRGVSATPTFFVGQTQVVGAKPYSEFKTVIEDELARLGETSEAD